MHSLWVEAQRERLLNALWPVLGAWGLSGPGLGVPPVAVDPEAFLILVLVLARGDARLFDELLDLLARNQDRFMRPRLKALLRSVDGETQGLVAGAWNCATGVALDEAPNPTDLQPLFLDGGQRDLLEAPGPMAPWGWARPPFVPSGKSRPPRPDALPCLAFKLRAILGAGAKSEILRVLLGTGSQPLSTRELTAGVALTRAPVLLALDELVWAGWVLAVPTSPKRSAWALHPQVAQTWLPRPPRPVRDQSLWLGLLALWAAWQSAGHDAWSEYQWASRSRQAWDVASEALLGSGLGWSATQPERALGLAFSGALMAEHEAILGAVETLLNPG